MSDNKDFKDLKDKDLSLGKRKTLYHGSNTTFRDFDLKKGGGMAHFAEKPEIAQMYAHDVGGSGGRKGLKWADVRVEDLDTGDSFLYHPDKKLWISGKGEKIPFEDFKEMMDEGERYFEAYPKNSQIVKKIIDPSTILDTYPDRSQSYHKQANKKGLEAFLDIVDPSKIENKINPQFTTNSQNIAQRLKNSAHDELRNMPGAQGFGGSFWGTTKHARADETNQALTGISDQLKTAGYDGIRFADEHYPTTALFKIPGSQNLPLSTAEKYTGYLKKLSERAGKGLKAIAPILKPLGVGASAMGALGYSDMAGAATDFVVPGGVEEMGVSEEQKALDSSYLSKIRSMQERNKK